LNCAEVPVGVVAASGRAQGRVEISYQLSHERQAVGFTVGLILQVIEIQT